MYRITQKFPDALQSMEGKCLKHIFAYLYCIKYNEINICHSDIKSMFPLKNGIKSTNILYTGKHKFSNTLRPKGGKSLKRILTHILCTKYHEINNICHSDIGESGGKTRTLRFEGFQKSQFLA